MTGTRVIGLTGPIGCGKSTVGRLLGERGAVVIDADAVAREVSAPGTEAHDRILATFGDAVRSAGDPAAIDRAALARIVFANADALQVLERIVHPLVRPEIVARIEAARADGAPAVVIEAIKLVEGGLAALCDVVLMVDCAEAEQLARLASRGMAEADVRRRIEAQRGIRTRLRDAGARPLSTSGTLEQVGARLDAVWANLVTGPGEPGVSR